MEINIRRIDNAFHLEAENETGNRIEMDGAPKIGGSNKGARPMEVLLMSLAGCSSMDVLDILKKQRQTVSDFRIKVNAEREKDKTPALFTDIHVHYYLKGELDQKKVERAIRLSMETYCSVTKIVEKTAKVTWDFTIEQ
ncbi:OsmC family protein [Natronogracilivirga saccharolytica]|uniref:OsmC family protein n=1 Tax=Natronogracilivirga saccharolytica TaxID=2812953 RepID=A0A8J7RP92_9BACT|nr:OsmC family protein [Natronogracilivirga saccharolytica]MBP3193668.1 OsmC family protein [Natronogracilivirga saccharolytica]